MLKKFTILFISIAPIFALAETMNHNMHAHSHPTAPRAAQSLINSAQWHANGNVLILMGKAKVEL